jgi:Tol biopolymer transport system component
MRSAMVLIAMSLLTTACGGGGGGGNAPPPASAPVATVSVAPSSLALDRGGSFQLSAVLKDASGGVLTGRSVSWSSDDASKVTVSATGLVTALGAGGANVWATAEGKTARAAVAVTEPAGPVARVAMSTVAERLDEGATFQLAATAYDATDNVVEGRVVRFSSSDGSVASVSLDGLVTALRPGTVSVSAQIDGAVGASTISVTANYDFELVFGRADVGMFEELHTLDLRDPASFELPLFPPGKRASHAAPSPDGQRIAFVVYQAGWESAIFVADRDGSNAIELAAPTARNETPVWSPDGTRIAFASRPELAASAIWVVDADGANAVSLTADQTAASQTSPAWSPPLADGSHRIAYSNFTGSAASLWTMRADGTDKRPVTADPRYYDDEPAWSPDGGTLVFVRSGEGVSADLYLVPSAGGATRPVMPAVALAHGQFSPTWSPDGRLIAFASKHADGTLYQVWTVWADGTRLAQRTFELLQHADPAWTTRP